MSDWLILESTREEIVALEVRTSAERGVEVLRSARTELLENFAADPEVVAAQIKKLVREVSTRQVLVVIPREVAVFRQFELPAVPADELPDLVRFQAATRFSTPVDELVIDYIPFAPRVEGMGHSVLAASLDKDLLERWRKGCELAGLQLVGCTVSSVGLAEAVVRLTPNQTTRRPTLIVYGEAAKIELLLLDEGCPLFSAVVHLRGEGQSVERLLDRELKRAFVTLGESHPGVEIDQAVLCGQSTLVGDWLNRTFPDRWTTLDLANVPTSTLRINGDPNSVSVPALGWALAQEQPQVLGLDFLRPRKRPEPQDWSKWKWGAVAAVAVLMCLSAYIGFRWRLSALNTELADIEEQTRTLVAQNSAGQPVIASKNVLSNWVDSRQDPVQFLITLNELSPETDRLYFSSLNVSPLGNEVRVRVTGAGQARTRADVEELNDRLAESGFRIRPKAINQNAKDPDYPIAFELDADWLKPKPAPAAADEPTATPGTT